MRRFPSLVATVLIALPSVAAAKPKIHVAFQWHMHQPIYWPYESVVQSAANQRFGFDLVQIHTDRTGPYTSWPVDAVSQGLDLGHLGAQVSFTGSLIENLDALEAAGMGFQGWKTRWQDSRSLLTEAGNPRVDLVTIGYYHGLMPLLPPADRRLQVALHKAALERAFGPASKPVRGMFPPETAFAEHIIPDIVAEGVQWVLVDNIHLDRARPDYPWSSGSNILPPNQADQRNHGGDVHWVQLHDLWAPSPVSAPWGYQPHWVEYVDPSTGATSRVIAVPAARYEGNEDARGGYGAFLYEQVMSQYEAFNTDDAHPMFVVLHHDGDNYGGGTDSYYHANFAAFVSWLKSQPDRFECTTVQDYLDRFPPAQDDVIHVEPGSWSGADNGDPEFSKWNGDPGPDGWSPDRHSWAVMTAAANRVHTAQAIVPYSSLDAIASGNGNETDKAWHYLLVGETSCYWYWDNSEGGKWDSHPSRAANQAVAHADAVLNTSVADTTAPTIFLPQRNPYNPGAKERGTTSEPSDFDVWTFAYDVSGLADVTLHIRVTPDGDVGAGNHVYAAGTWQDLPMTATTIESRTDPVPIYKADLYTARVVGISNALVDYYVSATDQHGLVGRTPIQHVVVGVSSGHGTGPEPDADAGTPPQSGTGVGWTPPWPTPSDAITVWGPKPGKIHWGTNGWSVPPQSNWPQGTVLYDGNSVESPLSGPDAEARYSVVLPAFHEGVGIIDFVMHYDDGTWDNNGGQDYHIAISTNPVQGADAGGDGGAATGATPGPGPGGCGCRTAGGRPGSGVAITVLLVLGASVRRRRTRPCVVPSRTAC